MRPSRAVHSFPADACGPDLVNHRRLGGGAASVQVRRNPVRKSVAAATATSRRTENRREAFLQGKDAFVRIGAHNSSVPAFASRRMQGWMQVASASYHNPGGFLLTAEYRTGKVKPCILHRGLARKRQRSGQFFS